MVQCFKQNSDGVYKIDGAKTSLATGFDVVPQASSIDQPDLDMKNLQTFE